MDDTVDLDAIALATGGAVGSDLANMINEAAILAVRNGRHQVSQKDLLEAVEVVLVGKEKKDRILEDHDHSENDGCSGICNECSGRRKVSEHQERA